MRFQTSDPDIATIYRRIDRETIDLQPDFQRGEVWSTPKKQRLIDTILRQWHVPPIHLVAKGGGRFDVLDGQQRLTAIRDFMTGLYGVDGYIEPVIPELKELNGLRFGQLPVTVRDEFETFAIRVFELHDFTPEEPHELFFRLNQPMTLTEAEKRNAFIGPARNQVKDLVQWAQKRGMRPSRLGFSNARMAYDDLLARFLLTLEQRGLTEKVTALRITSRYRNKKPFDDDVISQAEAALDFFFRIPLLDKDEQRIKSNKATIHTWLCMAAKLVREDLLEEMQEALATTIEEVESWRVTRGAQRVEKEVAPFAIFHDRATARVADVSSVVLRDLTAWMILWQLHDFEDVPRFLKPIPNAWHRLRQGTDPERALTTFTQSVGWGTTRWL